MPFRLRHKINFRHGGAKRGKQTTEYMAWASMKRRCYNPNCAKYKDYGGRGIIVYPAWKDSYTSFLSFLKQTIGLRPGKKHYLDRIDNEGNYIPNNIRWATASESNKNRRPFRRKQNGLSSHK